MLTHSLTIHTPAKINLFLHILGRKPNTYHELQTLFQFVSLYDTLTIKARSDNTINFDSDHPTIAITDQLVVKAAKLLQKTTATPFGADITLKKNIPLQAGLGGGSSDAAATLLALNTLWQCHLSNDTLQQLGLSLGADVPIFIYGHSAFASGIGEQFNRAYPNEPYYVIAKPTAAIATAQLFNHPDLPRNSIAIDESTYCYEQSHNDCEALVRKLYPEVDTVCQWLSHYGSPRLTGTGACVFLPLNDQSLWPLIQASAPAHCALWLVKGFNSIAAQDLVKYDHAPVPNE